MISISMSIHLRTLCLKKISARYAREKFPKIFLARFARYGCPNYRPRLAPDLTVNLPKNALISTPDSWPY